MITLKLTRIGSRNHPFYRVIAIEEGAKKNSNTVEILGFWEPKKNVKTLKKDRVNFWLARGARPSTALRKLLEA